MQVRKLEEVEKPDQLRLTWRATKASKGRTTAGGKETPVKHKKTKRVESIIIMVMVSKEKEKARKITVINQEKRSDNVHHQYE